jgi:hypothetical protein
MVRAIMTALHQTPKLLLLPLVLALAVGCDKGGDKKADDKKADDKKADDKKAEEPEPEPEPAKPEGPSYTAKGPMGGDEVTLPLVPFDLAAVELPGYTMMVPEGTKAETKSGGGHKLINMQVNYSITVDERAFDKEISKTAWDALDPDGKIVDESDTHIIYERSKEGGFLFSAGTTVGDKQFTCGSVASISPFTRRMVDQNVESCNSIAAAEGGGDAAPAEGDAPTPQ